MSLVIYAAATSESGGLLGALGINWGALVLNALAFLIILAILGRYVYPTLIKTLDAKAEELKAAAKAEDAAKAALAEARQNADRLIADARRDADGLVSSARQESAGLIDDAKAKAAVQAERLVADAHVQLERDVAEARVALRQETAQLVAEATGIVLDEKLDDARDRELVQRSLEGSR